MTGLAEIFANVTSSAFNDVTFVATKISFDDVTANHLMWDGMYVVLFLMRQLKPP